MADIVLLDGGMGQELIHRSSNKHPRDWSATYLMEEPDLVRQLHLDFIRAGARVITLNTYVATFTHMGMTGGTDRVPELHRIAGEVARAARSDAGVNGEGVRIAGSLPPLNGSYRPERVREFGVNLDEYRQLVALQAPYADFFICETMASADEARAAAAAAAESGKPVWVAWTLRETGLATLRSDETVAEGFAALARIEVAAVLANCTSPEAISAAMEELVATGMPTGGYANAFQPIPSTFLPGVSVHHIGVRADLDADAYAAAAMGWVEHGAAIVGGCCEVGPAHIARLRERLLAAGHRIVAPQM
jgi:S-methylmethionine-dependent homocysteine/selenocysteine methylase